MAYGVKVLANYRSPAAARLFTVEATYPRLIHPEAMTHRDWSRNAASSRAIPTAKLLERIERDPVIPVYWGANQTGMVAQEELTPAVQEQALAVWLRGHQQALAISRELLALGAHKQIANRPAEPWMFITCVISATKWENFFSLRCAEDAQPEIRELARRLAVVYYLTEPKDVPAGFWSLPYVSEEERQTWPIPLLKKVSTARVARISYLTHDGKRDLDKDVSLHDSLAADRHMSPFEHVAAALAEPRECGNFHGWWQYRKEIPGERRDYQPDPEQLVSWARQYAMTEYLPAGTGASDA